MNSYGEESREKLHTSFYVWSAVICSCSNIVMSRLPSQLDDCVNCVTILYSLCHVETKRDCVLQNTLYYLDEGCFADRSIDRLELDATVACMHGEGTSKLTP